MLREDRGYNVKVKQLVVKGLYGRYNYDVHFNEELTFLLGANGSGKTTILDMLLSIITGELYHLIAFPLFIDTCPAMSKPTL